jgi:5-methylcytosine-specific restriction enzyme B
MEDNTMTFTWMDFFEELADKVSDFRNNQKQLIDTLRNTGLSDKGLNDKDSDGNLFPMDEIDPFTYFSLIMKFGYEKRKTIFDHLKEELNIKAEVPTDNDGVPSTMGVNAKLVANKANRQTTDIPILWDLFRAALNNNITEELFENALKIKHVGFPKITQGLFWVRPRLYFPIDKQSKPFLQKHSIECICGETKKYSDYKDCLEEIKNTFPDTEFYILSHRSWKGNQGSVTHKGPLINLLEKYCPSERIKYRKESEEELKKLLDEKSCQLTPEEWGDFFKIINRDLWGGKKTSGRFGQSFVGQNKKLMLGDVDNLNKWTNEIWTCDEENIETVLNEFWKDSVAGAGIGFPTMILYLRDTGLYNIWLPRMLEGLQRINKTPISGWNSESYFAYNSAIVQFRTDNKLAPQTLDILFCLDENEFPPNYKPERNLNMSLNQILYGPPGTGKTYQTINYALSIIENKSLKKINEEENLNGRSALLKKYKKYIDDDQIKFITFHQNYAYEDFIQGLRPNIKNNDGSLSFELNDGVFKGIADKALDNYKASIQTVGSENQKPPFKKIFESYFKKLIEGEVEYVEISMKKASYKITKIGEKSILFDKQSGDSYHTLSINSLGDMYEREQNTSKGGLFTYYSPLLKELLNYSKSISIESTKEDLRNYVIIIDEINRANISRVFGELITLIEDDKRYGNINEMKATLPSEEPFSVPPNLFIIGTMNTADKSIALIDIALRRRFEFIKLYPEVQLVIHSYQELFNKINNQIVEKKGPDFQIGHAYFMKKPDQEFRIKDIMNKRVIPLLYEYFMNDGDTVNSILSEAGIKTLNRYGLWEFESYSNE